MKKLAALATILLLVAACSTTRLLYSFADDFIESEAEFYLKLDEEGESFVETKVDDFIGWHRTAMLPRYAGYLGAQADLIERGGLNRAGVDAAVDKFRELMEGTVRGFTPHAAMVLARHTGTAKIAHFSERLAERAEEHRENLDQPAAERAEERAERTQDNFERFIGDLTDGQLTIIRRHVAATMNDTARRLRRRQRNSKRLVAFLAKQPDERQIRIFLDAMFLDPDAGAPQTERQFREARFRRFRIFMADMLTSLTAEQRETLVRNLRDYAEDFNAIAS